MLHRNVLLLMVALALVPFGAWAQAPALSDAQQRVLGSLLCGACVPIEAGILIKGPYGRAQAGQAGSEWWVMRNGLTTQQTNEVNIGQVIVPPTVDTGGFSTAFAFVSIQPDTSLRTRHVCLGRRIDLAPGAVLVEFAQSGADVIRYRSSGASQPAFCAGELQDIEAFLKGVVSVLFQEQLAAVEKRTSAAIIEKVVRDNLADVLKQERQSLVLEVSREVVAELRKGTPAPDKPASPLACKGGVSSCKAGVPLTTCCQCTDPFQKGVCNSSGDISSWKPLP